MVKWLALFTLMVFAFFGGFYSEAIYEVASPYMPMLEMVLLAIVSSIIPVLWICAATGNMAPPKLVIVPTGWGDYHNCRQ